MDHLGTHQFEELSKYLDCARSDLKDLGFLSGNIISFSEIQELLNVINQNAADAKKQILDNTQEIAKKSRKLKNSSDFEIVQGAIITIYDNCEFQNFTEQKVQTVSKMVNEAERLLNQIFDEFRESKPMLNTANKNQIFKLTPILQKLKSDLFKDQASQVESKLLHYSFKTLSEVALLIEQSINHILNSAEEIQLKCGIIAKEDRKEWLQNLANIFEACSVQDLVGQRIRMLLKTFDHINAIILKIYMQVEMDVKSNDFPSYHGTNDGNKLYGPQLPENALKQDVVDNLMADDFC